MIASSLDIFDILIEYKDNKTIRTVPADSHGVSKSISRLASERLKNMSDKIYYTRSGLSRCGGCGKHFFIDPSEWQSATCPFCNASIKEQLHASPEQSIALYRRGQSRIATGLLALGIGVGAVGCSDEEPIEREDARPMLAPDSDVLSEYGGPPIPPPVELDMAPDYNNLSEYGAPPLPDAEPPVLDMAPDFGEPVAEYGGPPLFDQGPPDMVLDDSAEPDDGAPPLPDAGE